MIFHAWQNKGWQKLLPTALSLLMLVGCAAPTYKSTVHQETSPPIHVGEGFSPLPANATFQAGFSPKGNALSVVLSAIDSAKSSIHLAAYGLTSKPIAERLIAAKARGINIQIVADSRDNRKSKHSIAGLLTQHAIGVRLNARYAIHHHKFMVIDNESVETGSFNYTASAANRNAENVLWLKSVPELAAMYRQEWERLWNEATPFELSPEPSPESTSEPTPNND